MHSGTKNTGENLMMVKAYPRPDNSCIGAVRNWYSEVRDYDFAASQSYWDNWSKGTGHFTQVVRHPSRPDARGPP